MCMEKKAEEMEHSESSAESRLDHAYKREATLEALSLAIRAYTAVLQQQTRIF